MAVPAANYSGKAWMACQRGTAFRQQRCADWSSERPNRDPCDSLARAIWRRLAAGWEIAGTELHFAN